MGQLRRPLRPIEVVQRHRNADLAIAAVVLAVTLLTAAAEPDTGELSPRAAGVAALAAGALVWRRRWPFPVLVVTLGAAEAYLRVSAGQEVVLVAPLIALYTVADRPPRRLAPTVATLAVVTFVGLHAMVAPARSWSLLGAQNVALAALGALAVAAGEASRNRRAYTPCSKNEPGAPSRTATPKLDAGSLRSGCASRGMSTTRLATTSL
jgi:hypothetical protein